jgi:S-layer homology domain.
MKRVVALILTVLQVMSFASPVIAEDGEDICSTWGQFFITSARHQYRILPECLETGDYREIITREEFCELIYETLAYIIGNIVYCDALIEANKNGTDFDVLSGEKKYPDTTALKSPFVDTDNLKIAYLNSAGIVLGKNGNRFDPDASLTREEAATILGRMGDFIELRRFENEIVFADEKSISDWAFDGVNVVCGIGIMKGVGDDLFDPRTFFTKEQAITTAIREIEAVPLYNKEEIAPNRYFIFNSFHLWVEDEAGNVVFQIPQRVGDDPGYYGMVFFPLNGKLIAVTHGNEIATSFFDLEISREILLISESAGSFEALTKDHKYIIMRQYVYGGQIGAPLSSCYAVYDFDGRELIPVGSEWKALYDAGYVDTTDSVFYEWR